MATAEERYRQHGQIGLVAWIGSSFAFGLWLENYFAGWFWFLAVLIVSEVLDTRTKAQRMADYRAEGHE